MPTSKRPNETESGHNVLSQRNALTTCIPLIDAADPLADVELKVLLQRVYDQPSAY